MKKYHFVVFICLICMQIQSQNKIIKIWNTIPNSIDTAEKEIIENSEIIRISLVKEATLKYRSSSTRCSKSYKMG